MHETQSQNRFPLSVFFLIMMFCAILAVMIATVVRSVENRQGVQVETIVQVILIALGGMIFGAFIGLFHYRLLRGAFLGGLFGLAVFAFIGPFILARDITTALPVLCCGSVLIVATAFVIHLSNLNASRRRSFTERQNRHALDPPPE